MHEVESESWYDELFETKKKLLICLFVSTNRVTKYSNLTRSVILNFKTSIGYGEPLLHLSCLLKSIVDYKILIYKFLVDYEFDEKFQFQSSTKLNR